MVLRRMTLGFKASIEPFGHIQQDQGLPSIHQDLAYILDPTIGFSNQSFLHVVPGVVGDVPGASTRCALSSSGWQNPDT